MDDTFQAIAVAHKAEITKLYTVLSQSIMQAGEDLEAVKDAEAKFLNGFKHSMKVKTRAIELIAEDLDLL